MYDDCVSICHMYESAWGSTNRELGPLEKELHVGMSCVWCYLARRERQGDFEFEVAWGVKWDLISKQNRTVFIKC